MTITDAYKAALLHGLAPSTQLQLPQTEQALLEQALELLDRPKQEKPLHALRAITGQAWENQQPAYCRPERLNLGNDSSVLPNAPGIAPTAVPDNFLQDLLKEVETGAELALGDKDALDSALYHAVYAWGSRTAFGDKDVSVFDQNRLLAAAVQCLRNTGGEAKFRLLKGAISGIQSFIYHDISGEQIDDAKKASKRLRGRSFMVAHLCKSLAEYIAEELGLKAANLLFVGGGHFNLLLPDTKVVHEKLASLQQSLNRKLFEEVGMELSVLMVSEAADEALFTQANHYYQLVSDSLEHSKQKRYSDDLPHFFDAEVNSPNLQDEELGRVIPYASYLLEVQAPVETLQEIAPPEKTEAHKSHIRYLRFLGRDYYAFAARKEDALNHFIEAHGDTVRRAGGRFKRTRLNDTVFLPASPLACPVALGFDFIGNEAPKAADKQNTLHLGNPAEKSADEWQILTFEKIAAMGRSGNQDLPFPQLAAMRLDVDDLGLLFGFGLGDNVSFERIAALSREFNLFFSGHFNELARAHHLYITYSGGDDAFVIGSWLNVLHFAEALSKDFKQFTCGNPHITFSAGIFVCNPFYPVVRFADDAAELLDRAKEYGQAKEQGEEKSNEPEPDPGKNAVCVFNRVLRWDRFSEMMAFGEDLRKLIKPEDERIAGNDNPPVQEQSSLRRSMFQRFLGIIQASREDDFEFYRNIGRLHGLMSRHGYRKAQLDQMLKRKEKSAQVVQKLLQETKSGRENFSDYIVPLQYALHITRVKNQ